MSISDDNKLSIVSSSFDKTAVIWSCSDDLEALVEGKCKDAEHWNLKVFCSSLACSSCLSFALTNGRGRPSVVLKCRNMAAIAA